MTIFEKFVVRPYFGGCPRGQITIFGNKEGVPLMNVLNLLAEMCLLGPNKYKKGTH